MLRALLASTALALALAPAFADESSPSIGGASFRAFGAFSSAPLSQRYRDVVNVMDDYAAKCDGTTVDTARIQAAVNAAAGRARVVIPARTGLACISGSITLPSNSYVEVLGTLKLAPGANATGYGGFLFLAALGASNIEVTGLGVGILDGNGPGQITPGGGAGYSTVFGTNVTTSLPSFLGLKDITIQNTLNWPFSIGANHVSIYNVKILNGGNSPQFTNCNDCWVDRAYINGILDETFAFYGGNTNSGITRSYLINGTADGISVLNDAGALAASSNIVVAHNVVSGMKGVGATVDRGIGATAPNSDITFDSNIFTGNGLGGGGKCGVYARYADRVTFHNNTIHHDIGKSGAQCIGAWITNVSNVDLDSNYIYDEGQAVGAIGSGIHLDSTVVSARLSNNKIFDDQTTPTMAFGIAGYAASGNIFLDNYISPNITAAYNASPPADTTLRYAISGGVFINNLSVGAITAGSLQGTGSLSVLAGGVNPVILGSVTDGPAFKVLDSGVPHVNYAYVQAAAAGGNVVMGSAGSDANPPFYLKAQGSGFLNLYNANGSIALFAANSAASVNGFLFSATPTGAAPTIACVGDANCGITLSALSTGRVKIGIAANTLGFYGAAGATLQTPSGACAGNTGCQAIKAALGALGLINAGSISN